ncbi:MAG: carboxypeptidase-like regulatory domain-containing protein [Dysgonamonadaceae bacterium]|jgi:hypothetical protein|nr:carboxypeptidase-like regulatory domain-containing protein [Dysgonamonadaceae bacterium]
MRYLFSLFLCTLLLFSCNKDEGLGGSSSLEGYVYEVRHGDDNFSFETDTFPALDKDVFIEFGNNQSIGERIRTGREGYYRFDYLRQGTYTVYALSEFADGHKEAVTSKVSVSGDMNKADNIFIHTGKACGTAMIRGRVMVKFYHNGRPFPDSDSIPAVETRVFIKNEGEETSFNDVRVGDMGVFIFQKLQPFKTYEVYVSTETGIGDSYKHILETVSQKVKVEEPYSIYDLEEVFTITVNN